MRAVAVDGIAGEIEIALAIPCFLLCAMCPQMRNFASIEDVLLSFVHDTAPFFVELTACRHTPTGECLSSAENGLSESLENLRDQDYCWREDFLKREIALHADCLGFILLTR